MIMISFTTDILKFEKKGEKTGWTYIEISKRQAEKLSESRVSFRVKGLLDRHPIEKMSLLPMGDGKFILPLNAAIRKAINKVAGDSLKVQLEQDDRTPTLSTEFIKCLKDEPRAYDFFKTLPKSHQSYFSKWIDSAKTTSTKVKRITMAVMALGASQGYSEMIRTNRAFH